MVVTQGQLLQVAENRDQQGTLRAFYAFREGLKNVYLKYYNIFKKYISFHLTQYIKYIFSHLCSKVKFTVKFTSAMKGLLS